MPVTVSRQCYGTGQYRRYRSWTVRGVQVQALDSTRGTGTGPGQCEGYRYRPWTVRGVQVQALDSARGTGQCATVMPITVRGDRRRDVPAGRQGRPSGRTSTASPPSQSCHRARSHEANHERPTDPHLHRNSPHLRWGLPRLHQQMRAQKRFASHAVWSAGPTLPTRALQCTFGQCNLPSCACACAQRARKHTTRHPAPVRAVAASLNLSGTLRHSPHSPALAFPS